MRELLSVAPSEVSVPRALLPAFTPLILGGGGEGGGGGEAGGGGGGGVESGAEVGALGGASEGGGAVGGASKAGVLFVQQGLLRQWKRCWCVLSAGGLCIHRLPSRYHADERASDRAGARNGGDAAHVVQRQACQVRLSLYLELRSPTEQVQLQALSLAAMHAWADAINAAVAAAFGAAPVPGLHSPSRSSMLESLLASGLVCADRGAADPEWASTNLGVALASSAQDATAGSHGTSRRCAAHARLMGAPSGALFAHLQTASLPPPPPHSPPPPSAPAPPPITCGPNAVWAPHLPPTVRSPDPSGRARRPRAKGASRGLRAPQVRATRVPKAPAVLSSLPSPTIRSRPPPEKRAREEGAPADHTRTAARRRGARAPPVRRVHARRASPRAPAAPRRCRYQLRAPCGRRRSTPAKAHAAGSLRSARHAAADPRPLPREWSATVRADAHDARRGRSAAAAARRSKRTHLQSSPSRRRHPALPPRRRAPPPPPPRGRKEPSSPKDVASQAASEAAAAATEAAAQVAARRGGRP